MNTRIQDCDRRRIDAFLDSDHVGFEDEQLLEHLNTCAACREYMETQAADSESWSSAARLLQDGEFDHASTSEYSLATSVSGRLDQPAAIQSVLKLLAPSEEPSRLGRLGTYEVSGVIGAGGMGVVLKAVDPALDRVVAIKVMAPHLAHNGTARRRFSREAKAAAAVLHPNVIPIYSVSSDEHMPYLVMAYIRGGSLQKRLDSEGPLPTVEILRIGSQIAAGLAAAHQQGLVHRDIKPENILLEEGVERVMLTDFGLARAVDDASVTREGTIAGTPQYMSPEQASGQSVDARSDLFSLGSMLYTMCTGRPPFRAENSLSVMRRIADAEPTPIREINPDIPGWLCAIIGKLMAKERADRFQSAAEVHELVDACLSHVQQPTSSPLPDIPGAFPRPRRKSLFTSSKGILLMSLSISIVALFGVLALFNPPDAQQEQSGSKSTITADDNGHEHARHANVHTEQTYEISDSDKSIGKRHVAVTSNATRVRITDEALLTLKMDEIDCVFERDISAEYRFNEGGLVLSRTEITAKDAGDPIIKGDVRFDNGKAIMEWNSYDQNGRKLDAPTRHSTAVNLPEQPVLLPETVQAIGPRLLEHDGKRSIAWGTIDNTLGQRLLKIQSGWTLQRKQLADGGFELRVFEPEGDEPDMTLQFDAQSICHRIAMGKTTVMTLVKGERPNPPSEKPLTWKDLLGTDPPAGYPAEPLSLIAALNNSRGEWVFAGTITRDDTESEFAASMEIQGGFTKMIRQDSFPQWQVAVAWPPESPTDRLVFNIMALPEATGIKWMVAPQYAANDRKAIRGKYPMYEGTWNAETATIVWTSKQMRSPLKKGAPVEEPVAPPFTFQMVISPNGEIEIDGYQHNDSLRFSGQSAARVGEPYVEKGPAIPKLPGGYRIFFASRLEVYLEAPGPAEGAGPRIEKIGCEGKYIFGLVATYQHNPKSSDTTGYFWVDSESGEIVKGLELAAWRETLRSKGVNEPRLFGPEEVGE